MIIPHFLFQRSLSPQEQIQEVTLEKIADERRKTVPHIVLEQNDSQMIDLTGSGETGVHRLVFDHADPYVPDGIGRRFVADTGCQPGQEFATEPLCLNTASHQYESQRYEQPPKHLPTHLWFTAFLRPGLMHDYKNASPNRSLGKSRNESKYHVQWSLSTKVEIKVG